MVKRTIFVLGKWRYAQCLLMPNLLINANGEAHIVSYFLHLSKVRVLFMFPCSFCDLNHGNGRA